MLVQGQLNQRLGLIKEPTWPANGIQSIVYTVYIYPSPIRDLSIVYTVGLSNSLGVHGCIVELTNLECGCMVM